MVRQPRPKPSGKQRRAKCAYHYAEAEEGQPFEVASEDGLHQDGCKQSPACQQHALSNQSLVAVKRHVKLLARTT